MEIKFLRQLSTMEGAKGIPVVMVTTEGSESRVVEAISIGAKVHTDLTPMPGARKQARRGILPPWLVWPELCAVFKLLI